MLSGQPVLISPPKIAPWLVHPATQAEPQKPGEKESSSLLMKIVKGKPPKTILNVFLSENKSKG